MMIAVLKQEIGEIEVEVDSIICIWPIADDLQRYLVVDDDSVKVALMESNNGNSNVVRESFYTFAELDELG